MLDAEMTLRENYVNGVGLSSSEVLGDYADVLAELEGKMLERCRRADPAPANPAMLHHCIQPQMVLHQGL